MRREGPRAPRRCSRVRGQKIPYIKFYYKKKIFFIVVGLLISAIKN
jgi:hypothetical protein